MKGRAAFVALMCSTVILAAKDQPLDLRVAPHICLDPCTVRVSIRAEPHSTNRALILELDSQEYSRSSLITLDGDNAALIHERRFESLPSGAYVVRVKLLRSSNGSVERSESVQIVDGDDLDR